MNVAVIGLGKMGVLHTGILSSINDVTIKAVAEKEGMLKNFVKTMLPKLNVYDDYEKMLSEENLDLVYITTPVKYHVPIALSCAKKNINFFMEKPLATNLTDCKQLCNELKNKKITTAVGYSKRFWETFSKAKELLDSNILGDIIYVKSSMYISQLFTKGKGWRFTKEQSGGGVLLDSGVHVVDLLLWYFGKIKSVSGTVKSYYSSEVEDFAHASLEFENGAKGYIDTSWSVKGCRVPEINIEVHGSNGTMIVNDDNVRFGLENGLGKYSKGTNVMYKQELFHGSVIDIGGLDFTKEDLHVIECAKEKKQTIFNVFEASKTQSVVEAIYNSASENKTKQVEYIN